MDKKLIIQTNPYFTKSRWENCFRENYPEFVENFEMQFVSTIKELTILLPKVKLCFSFKLPDIDLIKHLKLLYLGISDIDYIESYNIPENINIHTSKGLASNLIAEHTLLLALSLIKNFHLIVLNQRKKKWDQAPLIENGIRSIKDYKVGVLGLGNNGRAIADIFRNLGCWVAGYSNNLDENQNLDEWYSTDKLKEILKVCDIIIVALPLRKETYHLIRIKEFEAMGKNSFLINIARGEIINESDLILALKQQIITAAAIDVFSIEPLPRKSALWKMNNFIITPHIAGNINNLVNSIQEDFIFKLKKITNE
jgi:phosphoglycerate dehydrogenase-like enzyme